KNSLSFSLSLSLSLSLSPSLSLFLSLFLSLSFSFSLFPHSKSLSLPLSLSLSSLSLSLHTEKLSFFLSLSLSLPLPLLSYHIANAYNNPLTLFFFFLSSSRLSSPWDAAVVSLPGLPAETLDQLHPPPPHCRTLTLPHTLCKHLYTIYIIATIDMFLCFI